MYIALYIEFILHILTHITCILPHVLHVYMFFALHITANFLSFYLFTFVLETKSTNFEMHSKATTKILKTTRDLGIYCYLVLILI
jgi:hypothetical protein